MILVLAAATVGLAAGVACVTIGLVVLFARVLDAVDVAYAEPGWWPDFEPQFAEYVESCE